MYEEKRVQARPKNTIYANNSKQCVINLVHKLWVDEQAWKCIFEKPENVLIQIIINWPGSLALCEIIKLYQIFHKTFLRFSLKIKPQISSYSIIRVGFQMNSTNKKRNDFGDSERFVDVYETIGHS